MPDRTDIDELKRAMDIEQLKAMLVVYHREISAELTKPEPGENESILGWRDAPLAALAKALAMDMNRALSAFGEPECDEATIQATAYTALRVGLRLAEETLKHAGN